MRDEEQTVEGKWRPWKLVHDVYDGATFWENLLNSGLLKLEKNTTLLT